MRDLIMIFPKLMSYLQKCKIISMTGNFVLPYSALYFSTRFINSSTLTIFNEEFWILYMRVCIRIFELAEYTLHVSHILLLRNLQHVL